MINCKFLSHVTLLCHQLPAEVHIWTHSVNQTFGPKSGSRNKCWAPACYFASVLQNDTRLQLCRSVKQK